MAYSSQILEEEIKNRVRGDYFHDFDANHQLGKVDFAVALNEPDKDITDRQFVLWAEAKKGKKKELYTPLVQLILTIGKERTYDTYLPPHYLAAFDAHRIAFVPYSEVMNVFSQNDFNWNVAPSDHKSKEFRQLYEQVESIIVAGSLSFQFHEEDRELRHFIKKNLLTTGSKATRIPINKNNFTSIYQKWLQEVKPTIAVDWEQAKSQGIIDADFYLADVLSQENSTLRDKLFVVLEKNIYKLDRRIDGSGFFSSKEVNFNDGQKAHQQFWNKYERPPRQEYWDYIIGRRDLLIPYDIRERQGAFYTPKIWVELSQQYLAESLGENWQDEYYVWDCAAGTGNLLNGLVNPHRIWASTLDQADVDVMHDSIQSGHSILLDSHVFRFDFLNDPFSKLPQSLQEVINDPEKRRRLIIYINPPYAEAGNKKETTGTGKNKTGVAKGNQTYLQVLPLIKKAANELFAQFLIRIYQEIPSCTIAEFSTLKTLVSADYNAFRDVLRAKLDRMFIVAGFTFDNVKGTFPIGFKIWKTEIKEPFTSIEADIYNRKGRRISSKTCIPPTRLLSPFGKEKTTENIGHFAARGCNFQNQKQTFIDNKVEGIKGGGIHITIGRHNLSKVAISFSVRHCIPRDWMNSQDSFLYPNDGWERDKEFQNDCLAYTLFHDKNQISIGIRANHWIPFTEKEVGAQDCFSSHFMTDYISGKNRPKLETTHPIGDLFSSEEESETDDSTAPLVFSPEAEAVFEAGKALWRYYHQQKGANPNAALYDIRLHFQGVKANGNMNTKSNDPVYTELIGSLRLALRHLAEQKIAPKAYEYRFLI